MTRPNQTFDWTAWYAKIPGIPLDWGLPKESSDKAQCGAFVPPSRPRRRLHLAN